MDHVPGKYGNDDDEDGDGDGNDDDDDSGGEKKSHFG